MENKLINDLINYLINNSDKIKINIEQNFISINAKSRLYPINRTFIFCLYDKGRVVIDNLDLTICSLDEFKTVLELLLFTRKLKQ